MTLTVDYPDNKPTPEQIAKLPKWAQELIANLDRRVVLSERALREHMDSQTPSEFFIDDYLCIGGGSPVATRRYVQTHKISVAKDGVRADILLRMDEPGIEISWGDEKRTCREVAMVPTSFQKIKLVTKEHIRI
jgi:hypothetical protein